MIEVSVVLFTLISEGFVLLLIVLLLWTVLALRKKKQDKEAIKKLVKQIKHQSQTRLEMTGSFLNEKYNLEGDELKKAVKAIDKAEKRFMQKIIQVYLHRDAAGMEAMDALLAELIDTYKSLTPKIPDADALSKLEASSQKEIAEMRESNDKLREELTITKETMSGMIAEFGNMFGGGSDHELAKHEVFEEVEKRSAALHHDDEDQAQTDEEEALLDDTKEVPIVSDEDIVLANDDGLSDVVVETQESEQVAAERLQDQPEQADGEASDQDEVDELLNSIDLSQGK